MTTDSWPEDLIVRISAGVKRLRDGRSLQRIEDRTAELGHRVSRSTLNELENGKRKTITLADTIVLAKVFGVPLGHFIGMDDGTTATAMAAENEKLRQQLDAIRQIIDSGETS